MKQICVELWRDENGFLVSAELIVILTVGILGLIVGLSTVQSALNTELTEIGGAFESLDQSYAYTGFRGGDGWKLTSYVAGSRFRDGRSAPNIAFDTVLAPEQCQPSTVHEAPSQPCTEGCPPVTTPLPESIPCPTECAPALPPCPCTPAPGGCPPGPQTMAPPLCPPVIVEPGPLVY